MSEKIRYIDKSNRATARIFAQGNVRVIMNPVVRSQSAFSKRLSRDPWKILRYHLVDRGKAKIKILRLSILTEVSLVSLYLAKPRCTTLSNYTLRNRVCRTSN